MRARIFVFAFHRAQSLEISGLCDVLTEANLQTGLALYDVDVVADEEPIICESGLRILPDGTIPAHRYDTLDTLVVVGPRSLAALTLSPPTATWLSEHALSARRCCHLSTGGVVLEQAGLPNKHVTPWNRMMAVIPAGIGLGLSLVEEDHGLDLGLEIARRLLIVPGQLSSPGNHHFSPIQNTLQNTLDWIRDNLRGDLSVRHLARQAGMSERNFSRVFRAEIGKTPADYVEAMRFECARQRLVENTGRPLKLVGADCGFRSHFAMRRAFLRHMGMTPSDYHRRHRGL